MCLAYMNLVMSEWCLCPSQKLSVSYIDYSFLFLCNGESDGQICAMCVFVCLPENTFMVLTVGTCCPCTFKNRCPFLLTEALSLFCMVMKYKGMF